MRWSGVLVFLCACMEHAGDGESCPWLPGDDGTCSGRNDGCSSSPDYPDRVWYQQAAIAGDRIVVRQEGSAGDQLWTAWLGPHGMPLEDLEPLDVAPGTPALWPGDGGTLLTTTGVEAFVTVLDLAGRPLRRTRPIGTISEHVEATFDGAAYLLVSVQWHDAYRLVTQRLYPDGTADLSVELPFGPENLLGAVAVASDGVGGSLITWLAQPEERDQSAPRELRAIRLVDGSATDASPLVLAGDGAGCFGDAHTLVHAVDGYHLLAVRGPCISGDPPDRWLVDLRIDPETGTAVESPSPLPFDRPPRLVAGPGGFLAIVTDGNGVPSTWAVDPALATATPVWAPAADEALLAAGATATGFVAAIKQRGDLELDEIAPGIERRRVAADYTLPDQGCESGEPTTAAPGALALLLLLRPRRRALRPSARRSAS